MINFLLRTFVKDYQNIQSPAVRHHYGVFAGLNGICLNVLLFVIKLTAGLLTASISITADAFNNLSDAGSSAVMVLGFKIAGKPADTDHPFGHGRVEYIAGLVISALIIVMGVELLKNSVQKILVPELPIFAWLSVVILIIAIFVKLWMCYFYRNLAQRIDSATMKAAAMDSLSDAISTFIILVGVLVGHFFHLNIDPYLGILVSLFILYTGFTTAKDSISPLLGQQPSPEFVKEIEDIVLAHPKVLGIHDMVIHNYGPGRSMISLHAEVSKDEDFVTVHDTIDSIENELKQRFGCIATIHMDPLDTDDILTNALKMSISNMVQSLNPKFSIHDFRLVSGPTHTNLIFDVVIPFGYRSSDEAVLKELEHQVKEKLGEQYHIVVNVDKNYVK